MSFKIVLISNLQNALKMSALSSQTARTKRFHNRHLTKKWIFAVFHKGLLYVFGKFCQISFFDFRIDTYFPFIVGKEDVERCPNFRHLASLSLSAYTPNASATAFSSNTILSPLRITNFSALFK